MFYSNIAFGETYRCRHSNGRVELSSFACPADTITEKIYGSAPRNSSALNIDGGSASIIAPNFPNRGSRSLQLFSESEEQKIQSILEEMRQQTRQAEIDREIENEEQERAANEAAEAARQEAEERAKEAIEKAEQAAEELRAEMTRSATRTKNNFYLGGLLLAIGGFSTYFITRFKKGKIMGDHQKYGVAVMIISFLLMLLSVMISSEGVQNYDFLSNLLNYLYIDLICLGSDSSSGYNCTIIHITILTKYAIFIFMSTAAYGLTTYLDITPAFKPWKNLQSLKD